MAGRAGADVPSDAAGRVDQPRADAVVGSFCRSRKTRAAASRMAIDSTPSDALPVIDVVVATKKVPMIEAVLDKMS